MRIDVFQAIADPCRSHITRVVAVKPLKFKAVANRFGISRPVVQNM